MMLRITLATVTKKPDRRQELEVSRKPLRREGRTASAQSVCSCALCFVYFARETVGTARTRLSLSPPTTGGGTFPLKTRARCAARSRICVLDHRHCERSEAIHSRSMCGSMDCFAELVIGRTFVRPVGSQ